LKRFLGQLCIEPENNLLQFIKVRLKTHEQVLISAKFSDVNETKY